MRLISKGVVAGVAAMLAVAFGASGASAIITPSSGTLVATSTGSVTFAGSTGTNSCTTIDLHGDINMNNPATQGGGGIVTGWTADGCSPFADVGDFVVPWTLNINNEITADTWTGSITNIQITRSICVFTGSLPLEYNNTTGRMSITGGTLTGSPAALCGNSSVTAVWDVRSGGVIPRFS